MQKKGCVRMGMPQIPEGTYRPNCEEVVIDLLESIALEEMAIAHMINAEGEKMQIMVKRFAEEEVCFCQLEDSCQSTQDMINSLIMKEWLLLSKMNAVLNLSRNCTPPMPCDCCTSSLK